MFAKRKELHSHGKILITKLASTLGRRQNKTKFGNQKKQKDTYTLWLSLDLNHNHSLSKVDFLKYRSVSCIGVAHADKKIISIQIYIGIAYFEVINSAAVYLLLTCSHILTW